MKTFLKIWFGSAAVISSLVDSKMPIEEEKKVMAKALRLVMGNSYRRRVSLREVTKMALDRSDRQARQYVLQSLRKSGLIIGICPRNPSMLLLNPRAQQLIA